MLHVPYPVCLTSVPGFAMADFEQVTSCLDLSFSICKMEIIVSI